MEVEEWNRGERNVEAEEVEDGEREVQHVEQVVEQELPEEDRVTICTCRVYERIPSWVRACLIIFL